MTVGLLHTHRMLAYVLLTSTTLSFFLATANAMLGSREGLVRVGERMVRKLEVALGGLLFVVGLVQWVATPWPVTTWWLWAGVIAVAGQGMIVARGIKPQLIALKDGDRSKKWWWASWACIHWLWIASIFGIMQSN